MVLRLTSGSETPFERADEQILRLHVHERNVVAVAKQRDDLLGLARRACSP